MLYITSIRVFEDCDIRYRKNLSTSEPYVFKNDIPDNFFGKNISIHAIVGKNGSGKSTLLEILMRLVNNLGYFMKHETPIEDKNNYICYIFNLHAEMTYSMDGKEGIIRCKDDTVDFTFGKFTRSWKAYRGPLQIVRRIEYGKGINFSKFQQIASCLFYTIGISYSIHSYNACDYLGEESTSYAGYSKGTFSMKNVWINRLFHKNDGYMCPIVLNPFRESGKIDMGKENSLNESRIETLMFFYMLRGINYIEGYKLYSIQYEYNPQKVAKNFDEQHIRQLTDKYKLLFSEEKLKFFFEHNIESACAKAEILSTIFKYVLFSTDKPCFPMAIFKVFGIDYSEKDDEITRMAQLYLICKVIHIVRTYPAFDTDRMNLLFTYNNIYGNNSEFDINDIFTKANNDNLYEEIVKIATDVKLKTNGHIGLKIRRVCNFLRKKTICYGSLELKDYIKLFWHDDIQKNNLATLDDCSSHMPPSIFDRTIYLQKIENEGRLDEPETFNELSSGERQFIFTTSTLIYHLQNLRSITPPQPYYHAFNVIFDEIEICFHPEYQREFIAKLLGLLTRLHLNDECSIHIFIATHSPFILSDIPRNNILYLRDGRTVNNSEIKVNPFAANINEILAQSFFLKDGFIGKFAEEKIKNAIMLLRSKQELSDKQIEDIKFLIDNIGEPLLKESLKALLFQRTRNDA